MKRTAGAWFLLLCGCCSTHPVADVLDYCRPGKVVADGKTPPHGGVCIPQGCLPGPQVTAPPPGPVFPGPVTTPVVVPGPAPAVPPPPTPPRF